MVVSSTERDPREFDDELGSEVSFWSLGDRDEPDLVNPRIGDISIASVITEAACRNNRGLAFGVSRTFLELDDSGSMLIATSWTAGSETRFDALGGASDMVNFNPVANESGRYLKLEDSGRTLHVSRIARVLESVLRTKVN